MPLGTENIIWMHIDWCQKSKASDQYVPTKQSDISPLFRFCARYLARMSTYAWLKTERVDDLQTTQTPLKCLYPSSLTKLFCVQGPLGMLYLFCFVCQNTVDLRSIRTWGAWTAGGLKVEKHQPYTAIPAQMFTFFEYVCSFDIATHRNKYRSGLQGPLVGVAQPVTTGL